MELESVLWSQNVEPESVLGSQSLEPVSVLGSQGVEPEFGARVWSQSLYLDWDYVQWIPCEILPHFDPSRSPVAHLEAELVKDTC